MTQTTHDAHIVHTAHNAHSIHTAHITYRAHTAHTVPKQHMQNIQHIQHMQHIQPGATVMGLAPLSIPPLGYLRQRVCTTLIEPEPTRWVSGANNISYRVIPRGNQKCPKS